MIIHNFNVIGVSLVPFEANPPLIVDPNAVLWVTRKDFSVN